MALHCQCLPLRQRWKPLLDCLKCFLTPRYLSLSVDWTNVLGSQIIRLGVDEFPDHQATCSLTDGYGRFLSRIGLASSHNFRLLTRKAKFWDWTFISSARGPSSCSIRIGFCNTNNDSDQYFSDRKYWTRTRCENQLLCQRERMVTWKNTNAAIIGR